MFDIGFLELFIIAVILLLVLGPERLPGAIRTATLWFGRVRRSFQRLKTEIEDEIDADHIRQQLHNESILQSLQQSGDDIKKTAQDLKANMDQLQYDVSDVVKPDNSSNKQ